MVAASGRRIRTRRLFEGRRPTYGAIILPRGRAVAVHRAAVDAVDFDLVPLDDDPAAGRVYADGRASFLVCSVDGGVALACFAGSMLMEADLVRLQRKTGAAIIRRTPVLDVVRIAVDESMITWDGRHWQRRPTAIADRGAPRTCPGTRRVLRQHDLAVIVDRDIAAPDAP